MLVDGPFGIQVQFAAIQVQLAAGADGVVVEEQRPKRDVLQWLDLERHVLHGGVAVEGAGIVARYFALHPGAVATVEA